MVSAKELVGIAIICTSCASERVAEVDSRTTSFVICDKDSISPTSIEHKVEEIYRGDQQEQIYNYIVYHFERSGHHIHARTYIDEITTISINGPFSSKTSLEDIDDSEFFNSTVEYLKHRFRKIDKLVSGEGYKTIWQFDMKARPDREGCGAIQQL